MKIGCFEVVSPDSVNRNHQIKDYAFKTKMDYVRDEHTRFHQAAMDALFSIEPRAKGVEAGQTMILGRWYESIQYHRYLQAIMEILFGKIGETESGRVRVENELMRMGKYSANRARTGPQGIMYQSRNWKRIVGIHQSFHRGSKMSLLESDDKEILVQMRDSIQSHLVNTLILGFLVGTADIFDEDIHTGESRIEGRDVIFSVRKK